MADSSAVVFATCVVDALDPALVGETQRVLGNYGVRSTAVNGATCCGQPAANSGRVAEARRVARRTLRALAAHDEPVVLPSGSCTAMIRHHWPALFAGTRDERHALAVAARTYELTEFLEGRRRQSPPAPARSVVYHASCHLTRHLDVRSEPIDALQAAGATALSADDGGRCCGFGGSFATDFDGVSIAMADEKIDALLSTGVAHVTSCDLSCLTHLQARSERRGIPLQFDHIARLL